MLALRACDRTGQGELLLVEAREEVSVRALVLGMGSDSTQQAAQPSVVMLEGTQVSVVRKTRLVGCFA